MNKNSEYKTVYLTLYAGSIPEVTPQVLEKLEKHDVKATFFCVDDNVRKYPDIYRQVIYGGHRVDSQRFNYLQGWKHRTKHFLHNIDLARQTIDSSLFLRFITVFHDSLKAEKICATPC